MAMRHICRGVARPIKAPNEMRRAAAENSALMIESMEIEELLVRSPSTMRLHSMLSAVRSMVRPTAPSPYFSRKVMRYPKPSRSMTMMSRKIMYFSVVYALTLSYENIVKMMAKAAICSAPMTVPRVPDMVSAAFTLVPPLRRPVSSCAVSIVFDCRSVQIQVSLMSLIGGCEKITG